MKRIICFIMVLTFVLGFSACHVQEKNPESTGVSQETDGVPPKMIIVDSKEALTTLVNAVKLSDAEFAEFVAQAAADPDDQIRIDSNTPKQEVEPLVQFLKSGKVPMLKSDVSVERYYFEYRPYESFVVTSYTINGVRYVFATFPYEESKVYYEGTTEGIWAIGEDKITLHRDGKRLKGNLYKGDYLLDVNIIYFSEGTESSVDMQTITPIEFEWSNATGEVE